MGWNDLRESREFSSQAWRGMKAHDKGDLVESFTISPSEVHVWQEAFDRQTGHLHRFYGFLSAEERQRAASFYFTEDQHHFIISHGLLRSLLGRYLRLLPDQISFRYGPRGKPHISNLGDNSGLFFNMSHSGEWVVFVFTQDRQVGIDVEQIRSRENIEEIAERFFSSRECAVLRTLPVKDRRVAFYNCWTRKEAYLKATGDGLSVPLNSFTVSLAPGDPAALIDSAQGEEEVRRWRFLSFTPALGYVAALAVEGDDWKFKHFINSG